MLEKEEEEDCGNGSLPSGRRGTPLPAVAVKRQYRSRAAKESCRQVPLRGRGWSTRWCVVFTPRGAERKLLLALHLPRAEKEKLISWFVTSILPRRKRKLFLLATVGRVDEWVLTTLNSSKYTGII